MRKALIINLSPNSSTSRLSELLKEKSEALPAFNVTELGPNTTIKTVLDKLRALFRTENEMSLFYFHGLGKNSAAGPELVIEPQAVEQGHCYCGVRMADVMSLVNQSPSHQKIIILDCPYSEDFCKVFGKDSILGQEVIALAVNSNTTASDIFVELLCHALEGEAADAMGNISALSLFSYLCQSMALHDLHPILKANIAHLTSIRCLKPK